MVFPVVTPGIPLRGRAVDIHRIFALQKRAVRAIQGMYLLAYPIGPGAPGLTLAAFMEKTEPLSLRSWITMMNIIDDPSRAETKMLSFCNHHGTFSPEHVSEPVSSSAYPL
ncbi:hypothetical protein EVAR_83731_1 [Eumeta japonica]|uniref:Uncharacterized protein n=1 Tax=Eumeta variegata TaxID=151549 RepID=A0A4C1WC31_EUMVA|nr:hypothetical protein EVAR_83731_1 [Eumeta japonica]